MSSILAYSTSTTGEVVDNITPVQEEEQRRIREAADALWLDYIESDPHCFVCGRHTDHWGEHDDMVEAGTARYESDGSVYPVPWAWDR